MNMNMAQIKEPESVWSGLFISGCRSHQQQEKVSDNAWWLNIDNLHYGQLQTFDQNKRESLIQVSTYSILRLRL